jgi:glycosyltransferase involved in cell wall biosynthesis
MNIAVVSDSLVEFGGAEKLLLAILNVFPAAHVFTSVIDESLVQTYFSSYRVRSLPINPKFFCRHTSLFQAVAPWAWNFFDFHSYDLVIVISGHMMSNLVHVNGPIYIQYLLSPPKNVFGIDSKTMLQKIFPYHLYLTLRYRKQLRSTPHLLTLSHHMRHVFQGLFDVHPEVIYPPVNTQKAMYKTMVSRKNIEKDYFLVVSRLDRSKSIELAIEACNRLHEKLVIVGASNEPAYERYLHHVAGSTVRFAGFQPDERLEKYYMDAKAFLYS